MANLVEYEDVYAFEIHRTNIHPKSLVEVEVEEGVVATFGEPKSKLGSGKYKLLDVHFYKQI